MALDIQTLVRRTRQWSDTAYLPSTDLTFVTALQSLLKTCPGDFFAQYSATNGDAVTVRVSQLDRTVFANTGSALQVPMPDSLVRVSIMTVASAPNVVLPVTVAVDGTYTIPSTVVSTVQANVNNALGGTLK